MNTYTQIQTDGENSDFIALCRLLDENLDEIVGKKYQRSHYAQFNTLEYIHNVIVYYDGSMPVACGSFKKYDDTTAELKRIFVRKEYRRQGIARELVTSLEQWASFCEYKTIILETGEPLVSAMFLYRSLGYTVIPNYGQYRCMKDSVCMQKNLSV
jgi:putative acetyltransferase